VDFQGNFLSVNSSVESEKTPIIIELRLLRNEAVFYQHVLMIIFVNIIGIVSRDFGYHFFISLDRYEVHNRAG
jgi:hypothetical protein